MTLTTEQRGYLAGKLLEDPLIKEIMETIEDTLVEQWMVSDQTEDREEIWYTLKGLQRFQHILEVSVDNAEFERILEDQDG